MVTSEAGWSSVLGLDRSWLQGRVRIEHPAHLFEGFGCLEQLDVGAFTYARSHITPEVARIGRYCSIAEGVQFGHGEHPTDWLSTSSFVYDREFMGPAPGASIPGTLFRPRPTLPKKPILIGHDVWIGSRAYIRQGVTLGDGCIVGAHAVVTRSVPPYAVVVGNPGRVVQLRLPADLAERVQASSWWSYDFNRFEGLDPSDVDQALETLARLVRGGLRPYVAPVSEFVSDAPAPALERRLHTRA